MADLWNQLIKCSRAIPDFIVWKLDHLATQLAAMNAYDSPAHREARARERVSFDRLMGRLN